VFTGDGVNLREQNGGRQFVTTQLGFPAVLTSGWDATTGYSWKRQVLSVVTVGDPTLQEIGSFAATVDNDTSLTAGTHGWMEPAANRVGYIFVPKTASGGSLTSGESSFSTVHSITTNDTWEDTGMSVTLPSAGTYLIIFRTNANAGMSAKTASNAFVYVSIYDATAAAFLVDSVEVAAEAISTTQASSRPVTVQRVITVTGADQLKLYGRRNGNVTWTQSDIGGSNNVGSLGLNANWTVLSWVKLA
jgi:hypothetical protein